MRACVFLNAVGFYRTDEHEPADAEHEHSEPAQVHDKFAVGYAGDVARHNHTRNNRAGKFKDMAEPEVDGRLMVAGESQPLACFLYNRRRETRTAERGQQAEKGRHNSQRDAVAGKNFLQGMNHASERTAGAQLDFEAHDKVECKNYVIGARQA